MMKNVEINLTTNEVNMIFHEAVPADYETLPGFEIIEKECEQLPDGGWRVVGHQAPLSELELLQQQITDQQAIIDELLFVVIPSLSEQEGGL